MQKFIFSLLILLIIGSQGVVVAQEAGNGIIEGQVINDTSVSSNIAGLHVRLITNIEENIQIVATTETDTEGNFRFTDVVSEYKYLVSVSYMEVDYYYPVVFQPDDIKAFVQVAVCDATESDQDIKVVMAHKIIDIEDADLTVTEIYVLLNEGDRTYVGGENSVVNGEQGILVFTLPEDANSFQSPQELVGDFILASENKVGYAVPFPPGERQLIFTYNIALQDTEGIDILFPVDYPTDYMDIMVKSNDVEVSTGQLAPAEPVETDTGERYIHFTGHDISRDSVIKIRVDRLTDNSSFILIVVSGIIAVVIMGIVLTFYLVKRKNNKINSQQV